MQCSAAFAGADFGSVCVHGRLAFAGANFGGICGHIDFSGVCRRWLWWIYSLSNDLLLIFDDDPLHTR